MSRVIESAEAEEGLFPIRTVAHLTGVNPVTLRAWERRYGLIKPHRTAKGHRLYSRADIERIRHVTELLGDGIPVSQARRLIDEGAQEPGEKDAASPAWEGYREGVISCVERFDLPRLEAIYNEALSLYPIDVVTAHLILPVLEALGERWARNGGGVAEEHFFTAYLRNKLGARFHHQVLHDPGPRLVSACLPGEQHEIGLLLFCLSASARGYRPILLGPNMPLEELPAAAERARAQAIVLSSSVHSIGPELERSLRRLARLSEVPVFVGGSTALRQSEVLERLGLIPIGVDIPVALRQIAERLQRTRPPAS